MGPCEHENVESPNAITLQSSACSVVRDDKPGISLKDR